jgi:putative FmdB family regulatory protein
MPIYEYKCMGCGSNIEKMQKLSDAPLRICEKCGGELEKQWSLSGFQFKGQGWYVTDYANKDKGGEPSQKTVADAKDAKTEKTAVSENSEKSSTTESTAKTETASKQTSDSASGKQKETASKNDKNV